MGAGVSVTARTLQAAVKTTRESEAGPVSR